MQHITSAEIGEMEKLFRLNLINSVTGYKSANLIATKSEEKGVNVAVFSSVTHLGSNPALLGFITRPTKEVARNTYKNIKENKYFTVNHIQKDMIESAHQTAAKYDEEISEFQQTGLEEEYLDNFFAPYVKQSNIKLGCEYVNEYYIKENETVMLIGAIKHIYFDESIQAPDGWLRLDDAETVAINGLDGYALPNLLDRFHYARPGQEIKSFFRKED
ncbi:MULTISPECIES: flavin reductase family protein [unclassified Salegentibacter]|uniref:flavin reductase family protein n=1 Tax=unclassified Salegentibacter TaxID=2633436 RepID=UPI00094A9314|nr:MULTISPECIES: flavin reductase [unclassified Salegentibacter]APS39061.1 flavin oxidoreductase [Salegentibacter sp. T436]|tara:strand:+ start:987 stop:1637 length:651 start_codon:yes stop_codon:yes gene_type:complete